MCIKAANQAFNFNLSQPVARMAGMPRAVRVRARVARVFGSGGWTSVVARLELLFDLLHFLIALFFIFLPEESHPDSVDLKPEIPG